MKWMVKNLWSFFFLVGILREIRVLFCLQFGLVKTGMMVQLGHADNLQLKQQPAIRLQVKLLLWAGLDQDCSAQFVAKCCCSDTNLLATWMCITIYPHSSAGFAWNHFLTEQVLQDISEHTTEVDEHCVSLVFTGVWMVLVDGLRDFNSFCRCQLSCPGKKVLHERKGFFFFFAVYLLGMGACRRISDDHQMQRKENASSDCSVPYVVKDSLKKTGKYYDCPFCLRIFSSKHQFIGHVNSHMDVKPFRCELCEKSFAYATNLSRHRHTCKGIRSLQKHDVEMSKNSQEWKFGDVSKCLAPQQYLKISLHFLESCNREILFACSAVSVSKGLQDQHFGSSDLILDSLTQLPVASLSSSDSVPVNPCKRFYCKWCGKKFWNRTACLGHVNSQHLYVKPFTCSNCNASFSYQQSLKRHQRLCPISQK